MRRPALHQALAALVLVSVLAEVAVAAAADGMAADPVAADVAGADPGGSSAVATPTGNRSASVTLHDQVAEDDGTLVTVDSVELSHGGFVAIHRGGAAGPIIGISDYLPAGTHTDVLVRLEEAVDDRTTLVAMAHRDTDGDERFDWVGNTAEDGPYTDDGAPVADAATVTAVTPTRTSSPTLPPTLAPTTSETSRSPTLTPTVTETPWCTGPGCGSDTATGDWTALLRPLLAVLAVATVGLLAVGAVLVRWRLAPDD